MSWYELKSVTKTIDPCNYYRPEKIEKVEENAYLTTKV